MNDRDGLNEFLAKEMARRAKISATMKKRKRITKARGRKRAAPKGR